jgi:ABC-type uncharacterized transport system involved in gliding motility auxiliary subunit/ABC-type transport system involved in multi-copper enzyme maturation permease subunit
MNGFTAILRREWFAAFATPLPYLFVIGFGVLNTLATFELGDFLPRGEADLSASFTLQPWLLIWLAPALSMRFWSEERRHGTLESLLTQPISLSAAVTAKWLSGTAILAMALVMTMPLWATVSFLGHPDHGAIVGGYLGSLCLGAALLAVGSAVSASTKHQLSAFLLTTVIGAALLLAGHPVVTELLRDRVPLVLLQALTDISALSHHRGLARGVVGLDDLGYFAALTMAGLLATSVNLLGIRGLPIRLLGRACRPLVANIGLLCMLLTASSLISRHLGQARIDLTEERLYTLAPATQRLIEHVKEPINLTLYASSRTLALSPAHATEARRLRELLSDISARARDRIRLSIIDPAPFTDEEDAASEAGLRALPIGEAGDNLWLGLTAESEGRRASIDLFEPNQAPFVEYRIAKLIRQVSRPHRAIIGLISTLPSAPQYTESGDRLRSAWATDDALRDQYDVRDIFPDAEQLPEGLEALLIFHPKGLSTSLIRAVNDYVTSGGRLLLAVDPDSQFDGQLDDAAVGIDHASTFEPLLRAWGITFDPTLAVGDLDNALLVGTGRSNRPVRHLGFIGFPNANLAADDLLTGGLHRLDFATPGFFEFHISHGLHVTPMIQTSLESAPYKVADLAFGATPETLRHGFRPTGRRYVIAARVEGLFPSAFDTVAPTANARNGKAILVADTDWLADTLWIREEDVNGTRYREPWANNGDFLLNAVDALTGGDDLVGLRGREPAARPFTRLSDLREQADRSLAAQLEALQQSLVETNRKIADLTGSQPGGAAMNRQQEGELSSAEIERKRLSRALRAVHHDMDREAAKLGRRLYASNLFGLPVLLSLVGIVALRRRQRAAVTGKIALRPDENGVE